MIKMTKEELVAKLIEIAGQVFRADTSGFNADTNIHEALGTKSLLRIGYLAQIEDEFEAMIPIAEFGSIATFGDLADRVLEEM